MDGTERSTTGRTPPPRRRRWSQAAWLVLAVALLLGPEFFNRGAARSRAPYSTLVQLLDSNRVAKVEIGDASIRATLRAPDSAGRRDVVVNRERAFSEQTAREIEVAVRALTQQALGRAIASLTRNRVALDAGAALLIERETLTRDELPAVLPDEPSVARGPQPKPVQLVS